MSEVFRPILRPDSTVCSITGCERQCRVPVRVSMAACPHWGMSEVCVGHAEAWGPVPKVTTVDCECPMCGAVGRMRMRLELDNQTEGATR